MTREGRSEESYVVDRARTRRETVCTRTERPPSGVKSTRKRSPAQEAGRPRSCVLERVVEESECAVVPLNETFNEGQPAEEALEGMAAAAKETIATDHGTHLMQSGTSVSPGLVGGALNVVRERKAENGSPNLRFTMRLLTYSKRKLLRSYSVSPRREWMESHGREYETGLEESD